MIYLRKYISRIGTVDNNENENKIYYPIHISFTNASRMQI